MCFKLMPPQAQILIKDHMGIDPRVQTPLGGSVGAAFDDTQEPFHIRGTNKSYASLHIQSGQTAPLCESKRQASGSTFGPAGPSSASPGVARPPARLLSGPRAWVLWLSPQAPLGSSAAWALTPTLPSSNPGSLSSSPQEGRRVGSQKAKVWLIFPRMRHPWTP